MDFRSISVQDVPDIRFRNPIRKTMVSSGLESEYRISLCNEQAPYAVIAREYSSTTQLTRRFGICFRSTNYHSDRCARLCKCWNANFSKRDYGQCDRDYGQHDFGVDVHRALPFFYHVKQKATQQLVCPQWYCRSYREGNRRFLRLPIRHFIKGSRFQKPMTEMTSASVSAGPWEDRFGCAP